MKRAVILHGTDTSSNQNWFPWLKRKFEEEGYEVWVPELPDNHVPSWEKYGDFLFESDWDFTNNIIIGHSSGAVEVLHMLEDVRCPKIKLAVCAGAWDHGVPPGMDAYQFEKLFKPEGYDFETIKEKADKIQFMHGDDDPYCPLEQAEYLAKELDATLTVIPGGHHLGSNYTELPELWDIIKPSLQRNYGRDN